MSIASYSDLVSAVGNWLDRDLGDRVPDFIALAEGYLNTDARVRVREAELETTLTVAGDGRCTLPTDYAALREAWANTSPASEMELVTPSWARSEYVNSGSGYPKHFTIVGSKLTPYPSTTGTIGLIYYAKIPALTASATTNWLLSGFPHVYHAATLIQAAAFTNSDGEAVKWTNALELYLNQIKANDATTRFAAARTQVRGPTP